METAALWLPAVTSDCRCVVRNSCTQFGQLVIFLRFPRDPPSPCLADRDRAV